MRSCGVSVGSFALLAGFFYVPSAVAQPVVPSGYTLELVASGARAADGLKLFGGYVYVADYAAGALLRVPITAVNGSFETVASGLANPTDVAFTSGGRVFITESGNGQIGEITNGVRSTFGTGFETCTSIAVIEGDLFVTNSTPGTITRTTLAGSTTTLISGLTYAYGISSDGVGSMFFITFGSGNIYQATTAGASQTLLAVGTGFGVQFTVVDPASVRPKPKSPAFKGGEILYVSDPLANTIWRLEAGLLTAFATTFTGKSTLPYIGPTGLAFDSATGALYVGDADKLWRIIPPPKKKK